MTMTYPLTAAETACVLYALLMRPVCYGGLLHYRKAWRSLWPKSWSGRQVVYAFFTLWLFLMGGWIQANRWAAQNDRLGILGIFYGNAFGVDLPWIDSWPYGPNGFGHPQYVACCSGAIALFLSNGCTVFGCIMMLATW